MKNQNIENEETQLKEAEYYRATAEAYRENARYSRNMFLKTGVFVLVAVCALLLLCIAWFVMNSRVTGGTTPISAQQDLIRIASKGYRQKAEESNLQLGEGKTLEYQDEVYYYTDGGEIAMRLSENYSVFPGACGTIDFYIIPTRDGSRSVTLYFGLSGYQKGADEKIVPTEDEVLTALLKGHILLFEEYRGGFYSGWMHDDVSNGVFYNSITVTLPENTKANVPYPYTVYWIWPLRYQNMVSHRENKNDIYAENSEEFEQLFFPFVESQAAGNGISPIANTSYYYNSIFLAKGSESGTSWLENEKARTKAYNLADEYIGTNADYLYLTISTSFQSENSTGNGGSSN